MDHHEVRRGIIIGVLLMMVIRSIVWLVTPWEHPNATQAGYALNIANVVICGLTAWATWRPDPLVRAKLQQLFAWTRRI